MNALSWALYAADALGSLKGLFIALALAFGPAYLIVTAIQRSDDVTFGDPWPWPKRAFAASLVFAFAACALPSTKTVYLIAASEAGERIVTSQDGRDMLELIRRKIHEALTDKT